MADHFGPTTAVVTPLGEDRCELLTGSDSLDEVALRIGLFGAELTVHEPPELRDHLTILAARLSRAAARP